MMTYAEMWQLTNFACQGADEHVKITDIVIVMHDKFMFTTLVKKMQLSVWESFWSMFEKMSDLGVFVASRCREIVFLYCLNDFSCVLQCNLANTHF